MKNHKVAERNNQDDSSYEDKLIYFDANFVENFKMGIWAADDEDKNTGIEVKSMAHTLFRPVVDESATPALR